jgi:hypothetical protein
MKPIRLKSNGDTGGEETMRGSEKMKKFYGLVVAGILMFLWLPNAFGNSVPMDAKSFATPENAITHFMEALKKNDLSSVFEACAVQDYSQRFRFKEYVRRLMGLSYIAYMAPAKYDFYIELNKIDTLARISRQIKLICYSLLSDETDLTATKKDPDEDHVKDFVRAVDPGKLAGLQVIRMDKPVLVDNERYQKNTLDAARCFGAGNGTERVALLKFNKDLYILGFHLYQYGSSWEIDSLSSPLAGTPMFGVEKITYDEYSKRLLGW